jgi:hypothetical protein
LSERRVKSLTWDDVWRRRLDRHSLLAAAPKERLVDVVRAVCGTHAQMMPAAELSIGIRVADVTRQDVQAELWQCRGLVKTYGLRGTVHLFPADELPLWTAALAAKPAPREARRLAELGLEPAQKDAVVEAIGEALDGQCLTRDELGVEVAARVGSWAAEATSPAFGGKWPRWQMALGAAANMGLLCFGPNRGAKVTFVRPDQWLGRWEEVDGETALRAIFRRYLAAYGPATHRDFAQWLGMPLSAARAVTDRLAGELEEVDVEGHRALLLADDEMSSPPSHGAPVQLLPHFDCYVVGCHPRDRLVPPVWAQRVLPRGGAGNVPVVLINGVVAGIWHHRRVGHRLEIRVDVSPTLTSHRREALEAAVSRIGAIAEAPPTLIIGPVDARPHL